jgi:transcriptional regulator with XRE-family HTH domain
MTSVRYRLKPRREKLGLTQYDLAEKADIRQSTYISMAERGRAPPRVVQQVRQTLFRLECERRAQRRADSYIASAEKCWGAVPDSPEKSALLQVFATRVRLYFDNMELEKGDIILELLPKELAEEILNETFPD